MANKAYHKVVIQAECLHNMGIDQAVIDEIMEGSEKITMASSPEAKARWFKGSMERMDRLVDLETRKAVREGCACCLGGEREKMVKAIARRGGTLEERIAAANEAKLVFGHGVTLEPDGRVVVRFAPDDRQDNRCVCLPKAKEAISETYCYCCGGHIKHHLQIALGRDLEMTVRSSALSSAGAHPCSFWFEIRA